MKNAVKNIIENKSNFEGFIVVTKCHEYNRFMTYPRDNPQLYPTIDDAQKFITVNIQLFLDQVNLDDEEITAYSKDNIVYSKLDDSIIFEYNIIDIKGMYVYPDKRNVIDFKEVMRDMRVAENTFYKYKVVITYKKKRFLKKSIHRITRYDVWARNVDEAKRKADQEFRLYYGDTKHLSYYYIHSPERITK